MIRAGKAKLMTHHCNAYCADGSHAQVVWAPDAWPQTVVEAHLAAGPSRTGPPVLVEAQPACDTVSPPDYVALLRAEARRPVTPEDHAGPMRAWLCHVTCLLAREGTP